MKQKQAGPAPSGIIDNEDFTTQMEEPALEEASRIALTGSGQMPPGGPASRGLFRHVLVNPVKFAELQGLLSTLAPATESS